VLPVVAALVVADADVLVLDDVVLVLDDVIGVSPPLVSEESVVELVSLWL
jgi:hypothetical protein